ncbi:uncharacterized protein LOC117644930 [Thrips palmi]|uniref:Uncharacterized protein LOC117644930 n=1 Tax=Thrips palmi TaxID=161013 RepID=A0A6P8YL13_THRPL|nr:uncharacterized protein LOC117644930 [Thrips palmi]XP_034240564.1 uncharacterized protein LOC117644930 [Thrips palmi]XP_034240565.1 uncharacterized protein LOC117644930 [Thrips palmi]
MPLFKVQDSKRSSKVTVCASSLAQLLSTCQRKLSLSQDTTYQVFDDSDGSLLDDDECLLALSEFFASKGEHLSVIVLSIGETWKPVASTPPVIQNSLERVDLRENVLESEADVSGPATPCTPLRSRSSGSVSIGLPVLPYQDYSAQLRAALASAPTVRHMALTRARRAVVKSVTEKLKNKTVQCGTLREVCSKINSMCSEAFLVQMKDGSVSSCLASFLRAMYSALGYARETEGITPRKRRKRVSSEEDVDDPEEVPNLCLDSNGCADGMWEPALSDEDAFQFETMRTTLLGYQNIPSAEDDCHVMAMVKKSFALQRRLINRAVTADHWREVFASWPLLQRFPFFMAHADLLMGKNNVQVWNSELSALHTVTDYFSSVIMAKVNLSNKERAMKDLVNKATEASDAYSSRVPSLIGAVSLLIRYFGEKESNLFLVMEAQLSDEEVLRQSSQVSQCPLLIVRGSSVFDLQSQVSVAVRGNFLLKAKDFSQALLVVILAYFSFNICYPREVQRSLEFLQRFILLVNPQSREAGKGKKKGRGNGMVNPAVATLTGLLGDYEASRVRRIADSG